ncbi:MAG: response regulator [Desulfobacteraceae bacterium]
MDRNEKTKILLIDDEESIRRLLSISLGQKGYQAITAEDGEKGIELFRQERPEIVLTDIKMPDIDGLEVLRQVKALDPEAQVIVITGHGDMESAIEALKLEASDFLNKPIRDEALMIAIKRAQDVLWMRRKLKEYTGNLEVKVKDATEELREVYDFQKNLIESSIDAIIGIDREGTILIFNEAAERLMGYTSEEVIGHRHITQIYHPFEVAREIKKQMYDPDRGAVGRVEDLEVEVLCKDGDRVPIRLSATLLYKDGEEIGSVGFFQDLRKIKLLQKELIERERLSAVGQTVAGMAHYIKNILNGLEGGIYMVNTGLKKDKQPLLTKGWGMVQNNVAKISDLVMDMLSYSREREPELESCSPNDIAQDVFDLMDEKAKKSRVKLVKDFDPSIDICFLDPAGLHRGLLNLVTNAIDACIFDGDKEKDWSVIIKTQKGKDEIRFHVTDNGMGMTKEIQEKIFERFFTTKGSKGSGFGLLVTQKTIEEHGGRVSFESDPGKGTTFSLHLPYRKEI